MKNSIRKTLTAGLRFLATGLCLMLLYACGDDRNSAAEEILKPVRYAEVVLSGGQQQRTFNGTSQSGSEADLSFQTSGRIKNINVKVGDRVRRGQLLAQIDQNDIVLSYEKAKAALQSSEIQLQTMKSSLDRIKRLYQANNASLSDYEQAKNNYAASSANYQSAKKNLDLESSKFNYAKITAPANGVVTAVNAKVNEFAQAGSPVISINSGSDDIEVRVGMPERYIAQIRQNDPVSVHFQSIAGSSFEGSISEVGFASSSASTYPVVVKLLNPTDNIRVGMPADVSFTFGDKNQKGRLIVPIKAVGEDTNGNFVYMLTEESEGIYTVKKQKVEIGELLPEGFEIRSGLSDGDLVATAGLRSLYDDRKVTLLR